MAKQKDKLSALQVKQAKVPDGKVQVKLADATLG